MLDLSKLDFNKVLHLTENFATCELAKEEIRRIRPLASKQQAIKSFQEISEAQMVVSLGHRPFMESLDLFSTWYDRLKKQAVLTTLELKDVRHFLIEVITLKTILNEIKHTEESKWLEQMSDSLLSGEAPLKVIDQLMTPSGEIKTDASEKLFKLYREKQDTEKNIQNTLDKLVRQHSMETVLQDRYVTNREGRWVLPVKSGMQHNLEGIIHDASQTKQTVFMEPQEVVVLNNKVRKIEIEIQDEIERLLKETSKYLFQFHEKFVEAKYSMLQLDMRLAQAKLALRTQSSPCTFSDTHIYLPQLRHPLLTMQAISNESLTVVSNDVSLAQEAPTLLLSGPNAGGKTILLKSIGLAAQMARCGLPIAAAPGATLPFFKELHLSIGDSQNVDQNLSTFAGHLKELTQSSAAQGSDQLILIDEICGSTDPEEGSALARSFIEHFTKQKVFTVVTSHLGPLRNVWPKDSGVQVGSMEYDDRAGTPTYKLLMGVPGRSHAMRTAKGIGTPEFILNRAVELLSPTVKEQHQKLEEIDRIQDELKQMKEKLKKESLAAMDAKFKYSELIQKFKRDREKFMEQTLKKMDKKLEDWFEQVRTERAQRTQAEVKAELPTIIKASSIQREARVQTIEDFIKQYPPGAKVHVTSLGQDGIIQGTPNQKGEVLVLAQSMRLQIHWEKLLPANKPINPTYEIMRRSPAASLSLAPQERVIDVRGQYVEEALREVEKELDHALSAQESRVKIIHGHGTDALKKSIRSYLSRSNYVKKWTAGTNENGGDGITWVEVE